MKSFVIYKTSNGAIVSCVVCRDDEVASAVPEGAAYIESPWPAGKAKVNLVTLTLEPGAIDERAVERARRDKNTEINLARAAANQSTFTFAGKTIAVDALSRSDIDGANGIIALTGALPGGWPGAWKAVDNTYVTIPDVATWAAFYAAMVTQGTANFVYSQTLKATLTAATTLAEVDAIAWSPP